TLILSVAFGNTERDALKPTSELSWKFDASLQSIYRKIIDLNTTDALRLLDGVKDEERRYYKIYLQSLIESVEILVTEDERRFPEVLKKFKQRIKQLEGETRSSDNLFLLAELNLQLGFCHLNLGENFSAILAIREAFILAKECTEKYPRYIPVLKTSGVLQVMAGAVPDKYRWFLSLLGISGSVETGQKQLNTLRQSGISLSTEAGILYYTIKGFISQQFQESYKGISSLMKNDEPNRLLHFIGITILMKQARSEEAYLLIRDLDSKPEGLKLIYIEYLRAEILLQKGEYLKAIESYKLFLSDYQGSSFKKDASMKISWCYHLMNQTSMANQWRENAKSQGKAIAEPDAYAAEMLSEDSFPEERLLRVRLLTDGGYLDQARNLINTLQSATWANPKDRTEFIYRKARLEHKSGNIPAAQNLYLKVIDLNTKQPWYFGASSALQMGYIYMEKQDLKSAQKFMEMSLKFEDHPYKNSIDGKAKAALEKIKTAGN
ncbi:MAG: tetratricopeptide repeat protein, partial [Cyclobacteriaceae bacterium]